jgi:response regulator of citrate/malate metabolism
MEIILVEDDLVTSMLHERVVHKALPNTQLHKFNDGKAVSEFIYANNTPDKSYLILLDLTMSMMDGWEFLDELNEKGFNCRLAVAVVTTSVNPDDYFKSKEYSQVFGFFGKPFMVENLEEVLQHEAVRLLQS